MSSNKLSSILSRAQSLMQDENFNAKVEGTARKMNMSEGYASNNIKELENIAFQRKYTPETPSQTATEPVNLNFNNPKLPKAIIESFRQTPPLSGEIVDDSPVALATANLIKETENRRPAKTNVVNEQQTVYPASNGIDYSLIKTIVDESVRNALSGNGLINENYNKQTIGFRFASGNKIQFVDSKGNLFEGVLKLKKKAK